MDLEDLLCLSAGYLGQVTDLRSARLDSHHLQEFHNVTRGDGCMRTLSKVVICSI